MKKTRLSNPDENLGDEETVPIINQNSGMPAESTPNDSKTNHKCENQVKRRGGSILNNLSPSLDHSGSSNGKKIKSAAHKPIMEKGVKDNALVSNGGNPRTILESENESDKLPEIKIIKKLIIEKQFDKCLEYIKETRNQLSDQKDSQLELHLKLLFYEGMVKFQVSEYEESIKILTELMEKYPNFKGMSKLNMHYNRGLSYFLQKEYDKSLNDFTECIKKNPNDKISLFYRSLCYRKFMNINAAIKDIDKVIEIDDKYANAYYNRGLYLKSMGKIDLALKDFEKVVNELDPDDYESLHNIGLIKMDKKDHKGAIESFNQVIILNDQYYISYYYRAECFYFLKNIDNAIADLVKCLNLKENDTQSRYYLGLCYFEKKQYKESIECFNIIIGEDFHSENEKVQDNEEEKELNGEKEIDLDNDEKKKKKKEQMEERIKKVPILLDSFFYRGLCLIEERENEKARKDFTFCMLNNPKDGHSVHNIGVTYYNEKKFEKALEYFNKALEIIPDFSKSHTFVGNCYFSLGQKEEAVKHFEKAIELDPNCGQAVYCNGYCKMKLRQYQSAYEYLKKAIELKHRLDYSYYNLGVCLFNLKRNEEAIFYYNKAINEYGIKLYFNRGLALMELKRYNESIHDFTEEIKRDEKDFESWFQRAKAYFFSANYNESIRQFQTVLKCISKESPLYDPSIFNLALSYRRLGDYSKSIEYFTECIEKQYRVQNSLVNRAFAYIELKEHKKALDDYNILINVHKSRCHYNRGLCYKRLGMYELAKEDFQVSVEDNPNDFEAFFELSECEFSLKNEDSAIEHLASVISIFPEHGAANYNMGLTFHRRGENLIAVEFFQKAEKVNYRFYSLHYQRAMSYYLNRQYAQAELFFQRQLFLYPRDTITLFYLACSQLNQKEFKKAISNYDRLLKKQPDHFFGNVNRAICLMSLERNVEAIRDYSNAIKINPDYAFNYKNRGIVFGKLLMHKESKMDYQKYLELKKDDIDVLFKLGITEYELRNYKESIKIFDRIYQLDNQEILAIYEKGLAFFRLLEFEKSIECYLSVLKVVPNHLDSMNNLGLCYLEINKPESAISWFDKLLNLNDRYHKAYFNRSIGLYRMGKYKESNKDLTKCTEIVPNYSPAYFERGVNLRFLGHFEESLSDFEKYVEINKKDGRVIEVFKGEYEIAHTYLKQQNYEKSIEKFSFIMKKINERDELKVTFPSLNLTLYSAYIDRAFCYLSQLKLEKALDDYEKAVEIAEVVNPKDLKPKLNRGICLYKTKKYDKAIESLEKILDIEPNNYLCNFYLGCCYLEIYKDKLGVKFFTNAIKINEKSELSYYNRGLCFEGLGKYELACKDFEMCLKLNPKYLKARTKKEECSRKSQLQTSKPFGLMRDLE